MGKDRWGLGAFRMLEAEAILTKRAELSLG